MAGPAGGGGNVNPGEGASSDQITQPLQGWPQERGTAEAVVDEALISRKFLSIARCSGLQGFKLACDRLAPAVWFRRNSGINGDALELLHVSLSLCAEPFAMSSQLLDPCWPRVAGGSAPRAQETKNRKMRPTSPCFSRVPPGSPPTKKALCPFPARAPGPPLFCPP